MNPDIVAYVGKRMLETLFAVCKSSFSGKTVKLPLDKCYTLDFQGGFDKQE